MTAKPRGPCSLNTPLGVIHKHTQTQYSTFMSIPHIHTCTEWRIVTHNTAAVLYLYSCAHTHINTAICLSMQQQHCIPTTAGLFTTTDLTSVCVCVFLGMCVGAIFRLFCVCLQPQTRLWANVCVSAYIYEDAPVYGDVSMHKLV